MSGISTVHVIFKTHLDLGFTDLAQRVIDRYVSSYIPAAIEIAERFESEAGDNGFVWTTGSWLIDHYLKNAGDKQRERMVRAIGKGHIRWHGLPFTTHTELMDPLLLDYGLSLSQKLDARFGKKTIAAKMTDVPGHTRALVKHMAKAGLQYLHIGVNPAIKSPEVPELFLWRDPYGNELIVHYSQEYGSTFELEGYADAIVFAHTGDNRGPSNVEEIEKQFEEYRRQYPNARVIASTLDDYAERLLAHKSKLPVVTEEIADNWIYGGASDPLKIALYRELLRLRNRWLASGHWTTDSEEYERFSAAMLMIPEHTWGMDQKKFLPDFMNYSKPDFNMARSADRVDPGANPPRFKPIVDYAEHEFALVLGDEAPRIASERGYRLIEASWKEQREYLSTAVEGLSDEKKREAEEALARMSERTRLGGTEIPFILDETHDAGVFSARFGLDGSIVGLMDRKGAEWADEAHAIGAYRYETFGALDYLEWYEDYTKNWERHAVWAEPDLGKPGMELALPKPERRTFRPFVVGMKRSREKREDLIEFELRMPAHASENLGAPRRLSLLYRFSSESPRIDIELSWSDKDAFRPPEASWFTISPKVYNENLWTMDKLGEPISPLEVVRGGNRYLHAVNEGLRYVGAEGNVSIDTLDAPVVAPGAPRLLCFDNSFASLEGGFHFNLHNNIYSTNFPLWFEEDCLFRFSLSLGDTRLSNE